MDLAEKRKQLEAVRAARQAKQQVVDQYMTGRSSNSSIAFNPPEAASPSSATTTTPGPLSRPLDAPAKAPSAPSSSSPASAPRTSDRTTAGAALVNKELPSTAGKGDPLSPASPPQALTRGAPQATAATSAPVFTSPSAPSARAPQRPPTASSSPSKSLASPRLPGASPGAPSPLIKVLSVANSDVSQLLGAETAAGGDGGGGGDGRTESRASPAAAQGKPTRRPASPKAPSVAAARASTQGRPEADATPLKVPNPEVRTEGRGGWATLQQCMRGAVPARDHAGDAPTYPVSVFNPAVVLGDSAGAADGGRRRVILDATACLVPYEGAVGWRGDVAEGGADSTIWSVCVAAAYGSTSASYAGVGGGGAGDFPAGSAHRRNSMESAVAAADAHAGRGAGGGGGGGGGIGPSAQSALEGVRASMECGYPWGTASASQMPVRGTTMDAALKVAHEAPGLVLAWLLVPLPPNTLPRKEGTLYAENSALPTSHSYGAGAASAATAQADYVVVVVPLVCDSEVTTLLAHPFQPSTLFGGTRCGRVVQWSIGQAWAQVEPRRLIERALATTGTATTLLLPPQRPIHSSFPSPQAHQTPVLRMAIHGDPSCHHLYSISQDGRVCTWPAWQPLHPAASCQSYLGIRSMGNIGVAAHFVERPGTDAMTQVFIGTTSGAVLVGANRDAKSIELSYYGPPRPLPTSTTVIKTLDVTASQPVHATGTSAATNFIQAASASAASSVGLGARAPTAAPFTEQNATRSRSGSFGGARRLAASSSSSPPLPPPLPASATPQVHRGRIVSLSLQTATSGFRGQDCVVTAATDGSCAAWFQRTAIPLEGFSSAVTSVCWSPTKAGVLAAGDASGLVTIWAVNASIITPVGTISLREASRRTRGSATSDAVLWVVSGPSDAAGMSAGAGSGFFFSGSGAGGAEEDDVDGTEGGEADVSLGQADAVGAAISSVFFSRDGRWLFASTACGYVYALRVSASLA